MIVRRAKLSHKNKVSEGLERFSDIEIVGYHFGDGGCVEGDYDVFIWTKEILEPSDVKVWEETLLEEEMEKGKNIYNMASVLQRTNPESLIVRKYLNISFVAIYETAQVIPLCHVPSTIFGAIKKVDLEGKDVIVVSSQTGVFSDPLEVGTGRGGGVVSLSILYSSKPDYIILASDTLDIRVIERHIEVLELISNRRVIGVTVNGGRFKNLDGSYKEILNKISKRLNIPVADMVRGIYLDEFVETLCNCSR